MTITWAMPAVPAITRTVAESDTGRHHHRPGAIPAVKLIPADFAAQRAALPSGRRAADLRDQPTGGAS